MNNEVLSQNSAVLVTYEAWLLNNVNAHATSDLYR